MGNTQKQTMPDPFFVHKLLYLIFRVILSSTVFAGYAYACHVMLIITLAKFNT